MISTDFNLLEAVETVFTQQRFLICQDSCCRLYSLNCSPSLLRFSSFFCPFTSKLSKVIGKEKKEVLSACALCSPRCLPLYLRLSLGSYSRHVSGLNPSQIWEVEAVNTEERARCPTVHHNHMLERLHTLFLKHCFFSWRLDACVRLGAQFKHPNFSFFLGLFVTFGEYKSTAGYTRDAPRPQTKETTMLPARLFL